MAQKLKEDVRQSIIEAAKKEFLEKGYKGASMRSIAAKANMTVGNLYRYYKNKEDINLSIVAPTFKEIENAIKLLSLNEMPAETRVFIVKPNLDELIDKYNHFSDQLVDIYLNNKTEFNILMLHSRISELMIEEFKKMISALICQSFVLDDLLIKAYAKSMFSGLSSIFKDNNGDAEHLRLVVKTYLRSFLYMLDNDSNLENK